MNNLYTVLSATSLMGDDVKNRAGEDLGSIEELMLDVENGRIAYAVLSFGGVLVLQRDFADGRIINKSNTLLTYLCYEFTN